MQKTKTIQIGPRSFTLKELPVRVIWDLVNNSSDQGRLSGGTVDQFRDLLQRACPELNQEVLLELYPSEIEELWTGFEEVNAAFLGAVRRIGLIDILIGEIKPILAMEFRNHVQVRQTSTDSFATALQQATVPESGTTATVSS